MSVLDDALSPSLVEHSLPPAVPANKEGFKMFIGVSRTAFPDLTYTIEDELVAGDKVIHRLTGTGTMKGDFQGMKANGKKASWQEMHIGRVDANGRIVEHWGAVDQVAMLTQLGFMPQT
jgi:predicted ester cyclase